MKKALILILLSLVFCGVSAAKPNAFFGAAMNYSNPESDLHPVAANGGLGGEFEVGLRNNWGEIYTGYSFCSFKSRGKVALFAGSYGSDGDWRSGRAIFGGRVMPFKDMKKDWLRPFIGGGLSLGSMSRHLMADNTLHQDIDVERPTEPTTSGTSLGWYAEAGLRFRFSNSAAVDLAGQTHHFVTRFQEDRHSSTLNVILSGVQARLVYAL